MLFSSPSHPLNRRVSSQPMFGQQHLGYSPGGAMDQYSVAQAFKLMQCSVAGLLDSECPAESYSVKQPLQSTCEGYDILEIIASDQWVVHQEGCIAVTGAVQKVLLNKRPLRHATTYCVSVGDRIEIHVHQGSERPVVGFRTYLCGVAIHQFTVSSLRTMTRGVSLATLMQWRQPGKIRVLPGPEFDWVAEAADLINALWRVDPNSSRMGIRLTLGHPSWERKNVPTLSIERYLRRSALTMLSQPVNDGTVQLTPTGLVVLMRDRQTVGGYPRVLNVISADLDLLAQYRPGQLVRLMLVDEVEALTVRALKQACLDRWMPVKLQHDESALK